jgi:hypothetical protein
MAPDLEGAAVRRIAQTIRLRPDRGLGGNWSDLTEVWHLSDAPDGP